MAEKSKKTDDIEIGDLFASIGNLFSRFFNFFVNIFKKLIDLIILFLVFVKEYKYIFGITLAIALGYGVYKDSKTTSSYSYEFMVQPNYLAFDQLYQDIDYYNSLVAMSNHKKLAELFNISTEDAGSLREFTIEPFSTRVHKLKYFANFIQETDSILGEEYSFSDFKDDEFEEFSSYFYRIKIISKSPRFPYIGGAFVEQIKNEPSLIERKEANLVRLKTDSIGFRQTIDELLTLREAYRQSLVLGAQNPSGQNISESNMSLRNDMEISPDVQLFEEELLVRKEFSSLLKDLNDSRHIIRVASRYKESGKIKRSIFRTYKFKYFSQTLLYVTLILLAFRLMKFVGKKEL